VSGLPPVHGNYYVWLFDSIADAVPVARLEAGSATITRPLPADPARYRYLDISVEPPRGNPNHSGRSVLRVATRRLLGSSR
jgi:hypothetical protein